MRSEERRGNERSQAEQLNWERDCDERECIWTSKRGSTGDRGYEDYFQMTHLHDNVSSKVIRTGVLTSDICLLRPPLVLKVLLQ